jgi:hypothetical protein
MSEMRRSTMSKSKKIKPNRIETSVYLKCDCNCSMFVVDKTVWDDGDIDYNITVQDSRYDHKNTSIGSKIKSAFKILFSKPIYYSDVFINNNPDKFRAFVGELNELCESENKT